MFNDFKCPPRCSGQIHRKNYFYICKPGKSADFPDLLFHTEGRNGKRHLLPLTPCGSIHAAENAQAYPHGASRKRLEIGGTQKIL
jgi:hypothetical protein